MKPYSKVGSSRGQTSVEYLVLLAIVIVLAAVGVGVLSGYIKLGSASTYTQKGAVYWKSADIGIADYQVYQTSSSRNSTIVFQNNREYIINLDWLSTDGGATPYGIGKTMLPGATIHWEGQLPFNCTRGSTYSYAITVQYDNIEHGLLDKRFTGLEKLTGACSN